MKKLSFFFTVLFCCNIVFAQKQEYGGLGYTIPSGYATSKNNDVLTYSKQNKTTGTFCLFFVYKPADAKGNTQECLDYYWENIVQKQNNTTVSANMQKEAETKGWRFLSGNAKFESGGVPVIAMQFTFTVENKMQNVIILFNSADYQKDIENFFASADMIKAAATVKTPVPSANVKTSPVGASGKGPAEVWMKSKFEYDMMKHMSVTKYEWMAIYPDGRFNPYMPSEGYAAFMKIINIGVKLRGTVTDLLLAIT